MTLYAASDRMAVTVSATGHGGCGNTHSRPVTGGVPAALWALDCPPCENYLRQHDTGWAATRSKIPETYDEKLVREDFQKRGALDRDNIMTLAMAKVAGIDPAMLPESLTRMISGVPFHLPNLPVAGLMECPSGHAQPPGQKFCGECGATMSAPVTAGALPAPRPHAEQPAVHRPASRPRRLQDARLDELQRLAKNAGLDGRGTRKILTARLKAGGVTAASLDSLLAGV